MAEYISARTAAVAIGDATEFTVTTSTGVSCYGAHGDEVVGQVYKKNSDDTFSLLNARTNPAANPRPVVLTGRHMAFPIVQAGTYKIVKQLTKGTVGIDIEEG